MRATDAFHFPEDDALVFQLVINNRVDNALEHTPQKLDVHVDDRVFTASLTDLVSAVAPHALTIGFVVVSGGSAGRKNLSLKNDITFVLARRQSAPEAAVPDSKDVEPAPLPQ